MELVINGSAVETDPEGYLRDLSQWSEDLALTIAEREGLTMTEEHWEIVRFLRRGYEEFGVVPNIRQLQKALGEEYGPEKADKQYLYGLFPYGPAKQACRIAGLPKPTGCV
ncbi:MAG: TusE/DsrC/DsvC family sulfur relay protein [Rhodocyclales bacterium]|nr:TusE/DsrC/DsvC family sulfur relay protein [Rhodocyclales bacterium]